MTLLTYRTYVAVDLMKCFNHQGVDAVAICKNCNKALCHDCAADVGTVLPALVRAKRKSKRSTNSSGRNRTAAQRTGYAYHRNAIVCSLLALIFAYLSVEAYQSGRSPYLVVTAGSAVIFFMAAFFNYTAGQKFMRGGS
jgi:hypothetical protein